MRKTRVAFSAYLYTDGTLVQPFEEHRGGVKVGESVDITRGYCTLEIFGQHDPHEKWARKDRVRFGRIVLTTWLNAGFVELARGGAVRAVMPDCRAGVDGVAVQAVTLVTRHGLELTWREIPLLLDAVFTIESRAAKVTAARGDRWSGMDVFQVKDVRGGRDGAR